MRYFHVRDVEETVPAATAATSVPMDWTRFPWFGGKAPDVSEVHGVPGGMAAINHDTHPCAFAWLGLCVLVICEVIPRPPPT